MRRSLELVTRVQGERHYGTLLEKARLGNLLLEVGRTDEGRALLADAQRELGASGHRIDPAFAQYLRGTLGLRWVERGRPDLLLPILSPEIDELRRTLPHSALTAARLRSRAQALAALGQHAAAREALAESQATWTRFADGSRSPVVEALLALAWADVELASARPQEALAALDRYPATDTRARINYPLKRARALLALGDTKQAQAALQEAAQAIAALPETERPLPPIAERLLLDGRVQLSLGDLRAAEQRLREALALRLRHDDEHSLWVAEVRETLAEALDRQRKSVEAGELRKAAAHARGAVAASAAAASRPVAAARARSG